MASSLALKRLLSSDLLPKSLTAPILPIANFPSAALRSFSADAAQNHGGDVHSAPVAVLFHASGLTCNQWRKLKNLLNPGKTLFRPSIGDSGIKKKFFEQLNHSAGPTCVLCLPEGASEKLNLLPSGDSVEHQDLLLLYGRYKSNLVDHIDVGKVSEFDEMESSLFNFYLPSSYLCSVLDPVFAKEEGEQTGSEAPQASAEQS